MSNPITPPAPTTPPAAQTSTVQIWLIVGILAAQLIAAFFYLGTLDLSGYLSATMDMASYSSDPESILALYGFIFTPGYAVVLVLGFLGYVGTVALAYFDSRTLEARGVVKPFHWALAFIPSYGSLVYVIGRSVVVRRRTGSGLAPLWAYIAVFVLGTIGSLVISFVIVADVMTDFSDYLG